MSENDQPFSKPWERYTLDGLIGSDYYIEGSAAFDEVFENMKPQCPACSQPLSTEHVQDGW